MFNLSSWPRLCLARISGGAISIARPSREHRRAAISRGTAVVGFALVLANVVGPASAWGGEYVMRTCDVPGHPNRLLGPWDSESADDAPTTLAVADACASGDGVALAFMGSRSMPASSGRSFELYAPRTGPQSAIGIVKVKLWYAARLSSTGSPITMYVIEHLSAGDRYVRPLGAVGEDLVYEYRFPRPSDHFTFNVRCSFGQRNAPNCEAASTVPVLVRGMEITLTEDAVPIVSSIGGSLVAGGIQSGAGTVSYSTFDHQSGLKRVEAMLGDTVVGARDLTPRCHQYDFTVCPNADDGSLSVDTAAVPDGSYRLTVRVHDAADNVTSVQYPAEIRVENRPQGANAPAPSAIAGGATTNIAARFATSTRTSLIVPWGRRVTLRGRLTADSSRGVGGAPLDVFERSSRDGAKEVAVGHVQTRSDGTFSYELAARRPSRVVRLAYGSVASSRRLQVRVRAATALRATLRGRLLRFSGRVLSRPLPAAGKLVRLEGVSTGFKWRRFATLRTDRDGRFSGRFRLAGRRAGARYYMRVRMPAERGYPYLAATSKPARLRAR